MRLIDSGTIVAGIAGTPHAMHTFPAGATLADGTILLTSRRGSTKDCDDETVELRRSFDGGVSWSAATQPWPLPHAGLKLCYLAALDDRLLAAAMWVDHTQHPGAPLFNPTTEGCLPMAIWLSESHDAGTSWSAWRAVPLPADIGPPSLTAPPIALGDGRLALSIESNKHYDDPAPWRQRVVLVHSGDGGQSWGAPLVAGHDPGGRIFNWDQRIAQAPDGRLAALLWTYDRETQRYQAIHRRISADGGTTWSAAEALGFADQPGRPAVLPDGRMVLPYVDRFGSQTITLRWAADIAAPFADDDQLVLYQHGASSAAADDTTGALLDEMGRWSFGLPFAWVLPDGDVMVTYYAGDTATLDIRYARLRPER